MCRVTTDRSTRNPDLIPTLIFRYVCLYKRSIRELTIVNKETMECRVAPCENDGLVTGCEFESHISYIPQENKGKLLELLFPRKFHHDKDEVIASLR